MTNETVFILHSITIGTVLLGALLMGKECLIALTTIFILLANLFVTKQITLLGFEVTATDAFAIGSVLGMNMIQEYYGNTAARATIGIGFFTALFFTLMSMIHLTYQPNSFDLTHHHFVALLTPMPRIIIASLSSYLASQTLDYYLFSFFKKKFSSQTLIMRYSLSTALSQLFDTTLFSFLGLYGIVHNIWHLIFVSYCIKLLVILLSIPFAWLSSKLIKGRTS